MSNAHTDWSRAFHDPITLPNGRVLKTLHDAEHYATALPKTEQERVEWQTAAEMLIMAAKGERPLIFAEIGVRQALRIGGDVPAPPMPTPRRRKPPARKFWIVR